MGIGIVHTCDDTTYTVGTECCDISGDTQATLLLFVFTDNTEIPLMPFPTYKARFSTILKYNTLQNVFKFI